MGHAAAFLEAESRKWDAKMRAHEEALERRVRVAHGAGEEWEGFRRSLEAATTATASLRFAATPERSSTSVVEELLRFGRPTTDVTIESADGQAMKFLGADFAFEPDNTATMGYALAPHSDAADAIGYAFDVIVDNRRSKKPPAFTLQEIAHALWGNRRAARALIGERLDNEVERLRLNETERDVLRRGDTAAARRLWVARTQGDDETWASAQAHAWRTLRTEGRDDTDR
jgi:hypothetical protein